MARLQQVPERTGKNRRVHRQARNQSRLGLGLAFAPESRYLAPLVANFLEDSWRTILGSRRTGHRLGDENAFFHPQWDVSVFIADGDSVRKSLHSRCIRGR